MAVLDVSAASAPREVLPERTSMLADLPDTRRPALERVATTRVADQGGPLGPLELGRECGEQEFGDAVLRLLEEADGDHLVDRGGGGPDRLESHPHGLFATPMARGPTGRGDQSPPNSSASAQATTRQGESNLEPRVFHVPEVPGLGKRHVSRVRVALGRRSPGSSGRPPQPARRPRGGWPGRGRFRPGFAV